MKRKPFVAWKGEPCDSCRNNINPECYLGADDKGEHGCSGYSKRMKEEIKGCTYSLFATDDGEIMSGGISLNINGSDEDEFFKFISEEFIREMKRYLADNPNKLFVFTLQFGGTD